MLPDGKYIAILFVLKKLLYSTMVELQTNLRQKVKLHY